MNGFTFEQDKYSIKITSISSFPKVLLSRAYLVASSKARCASPTAPAAT